MGKTDFRTQNPVKDSDTRTDGKTKRAIPYSIGDGHYGDCLKLSTEFCLFREYFPPHQHRCWRPWGGAEPDRRGLAGDGAQQPSTRSRSRLDTHVFNSIENDFKGN